VLPDDSRLHRSCSLFSAFKILRLGYTSRLKAWPSSTDHLFDLRAFDFEAFVTCMQDQKHL
jgi:hypothetical protein